jgi:hypothetical protein
MALSAFSDLTLGNVSSISVLCLPLWSTDLSNAEHYHFGETNTNTPAPYVAHQRDDISEHSISIDAESIFFTNNVPQTERWEKIRKDAAERAARPNEEQTRRSRSQKYGAHQHDGMSEENLFFANHVPTSDRWAKIRKNAAERAARLTEEQTRRGQSQRTDEDESSGDEIVEARVARIKARVAELTAS